MACIAQESIRKVAAFNKYTSEIPEGLTIAQVTKHTFKMLGEEGIIRNALNHTNQLLPEWVTVMRLHCLE